MKKALSLILVFVMMFSLAGCQFGNSENPEEDKLGEHSFFATVVEIEDNTALVRPLEQQEGLEGITLVIFDISELEFGADKGEVIEIGYDGKIAKSNPAQITATSWACADDLRGFEYTEQWLDKSTAESDFNLDVSDFVITQIYANCFFAQTAIPLPHSLKFNGSLSKDWNAGDTVSVTYENIYYDSETGRVEADFVSVSPSDFEPDPDVAYKPVIYLYPEEKTEVSVKLDLNLNGKLTCTYPRYNGGWEVTAQPDGTLTDKDGKDYNYLYWEGEINADWDTDKGFCIKGEDTAAFLEESLEKLGLNRREANEFIVYWLPLMQDNPYNIINFQTDAYTAAAELSITPTPDAVIRVFMTYKPSKEFVNIQEQTLISPERNGFTAVEWGGSEIG